MDIAGQDALVQHSEAGSNVWRQCRPGMGAVQVLQSPCLDVPEPSSSFASCGGLPLTACVALCVSLPPGLP